MFPKAFQLVLRLYGSPVLAPSVEHRRRLAAGVFHADRDRRLLAFRAADTHIHCLLLADERDSLAFARRFAIPYSRILGREASFDRTRCWPIRDQWHLENAFYYVLGQERRHGIDSDPFHDASNLPDLLGLRLIGDYTRDNVRWFLQRVRRDELVELLGGNPAGPITSWSKLQEAAAAAACVADLSGQGRRTRDARRAALAVLGDCATAAEAAMLLGVSRWTVARSLAEPVDERLRSAVEGQLRMRQESRRGADEQVRRSSRESARRAPDLVAPMASLPR